MRLKINKENARKEAERHVASAAVKRSDEEAVDAERVAKEAVEAERVAKLPRLSATKVQSRGGVGNENITELLASSRLGSCITMGARDQLVRKEVTEDEWGAFFVQSGLITMQ